MTTNKPEVFEVYRTKQGTLENVVLLADYESLQAERDALSAHVERLMGCLVVDNDGADIKKVSELREVISQQPTTSLTRLKAKWQAEALYEYTHGSYIMPATLNLAMCKRANELRRQAEENDHGCV